MKLDAQSILTGVILAAITWLFHTTIDLSGRMIATETYIKTDLVALHSEIKNVSDEVGQVSNQLWQMVREEKGSTGN